MFHSVLQLCLAHIEIMPFTYFFFNINEIDINVEKSQQGKNVERIKDTEFRAVKDLFKVVTHG